MLRYLQGSITMKGRKRKQNWGEGPQDGMPRKSLPIRLGAPKQWCPAQEAEMLPLLPLCLTQLLAMGHLRMVRFPTPWSWATSPSLNGSEYKHLAGLQGRNMTIVPKTKKKLRKEKKSVRRQKTVQYAMGCHLVTPHIFT